MFYWYTENTIYSRNIENTKKLKKTKICSLKFYGDKACKTIGILRNGTGVTLGFPEGNKNIYMNL